MTGQRYVEKYTISCDDEDVKDFLKVATTFMRRFMTGQYPPVKLSR